MELAEREARVLKSLSHPRLPRYFDHFEFDGALYLVMEKIEGESLAALRKRGKGLTEDDCLRLLRDASEVLDYLHGRNPPVIHRDLKPGNVIRRPDGSFAFVDFGAVRDKLRSEGGSTVVGTFGYMAPEQFQGRALPASDVYAVGATIVAVLSGTEPEQLPHKGLAVDVRTALRGHASERLTSVLEQMLDPDPDRRPSRIAPLLAQFDSRRSRVDPAPASDRYAGGRRQRREARRQARRQGREARRRNRHSGWAPWPIRLAFSLLFLALILAVTIATQVVIPLALSLLSLFFARQALRSAAGSVRDAGQRAVQSIRRTGREFGEQDRGEEIRARVEEEGPTRARVQQDDFEEEADPIEEDEAASGRR